MSMYDWWTTPLPAAATAPKGETSMTQRDDNLTDGPPLGDRQTDMRTLHRADPKSEKYSRAMDRLISAWQVDTRQLGATPTVDTLDAWVEDLPGPATPEELLERGRYTPGDLEIKQAGFTGDTCPECGSKEVTSTFGLIRGGHGTHVQCTECGHVLSFTPAE